ncbi:MAG: ELM1/GtrOC1 family putative glycosyltransferase [Hyphomicrobiaceae bacterium]
MDALAILILSDGRPGHYHLSEGVAAAIARRRPVDVFRLDVRRHNLLPARVQSALLASGLSPALVLRLAYGVSAKSLPAARLVISAGGDTIGALVATSRLLKARSIFCGTLRHFDPTDLDLVVSSYARHANLPHHLVTLKPNGMDPDNLPDTPPRPDDRADGLPRVAGLLIGGNSGLFKYTDDEWAALLAFLLDSHAQFGIRWIVSTSRRSPAAVGDQLARMAGEQAAIERFIDFRHAGPGTLPGLFARVDAILATEDSSTMLSEAVCARLPVVGVSPRQSAFKDDEREYRTLMTREGWLRSLALGALTPQSFVAALSEVQPLTINHLDKLADALVERMPGLFADTVH